MAKKNNAPDHGAELKRLLLIIFREHPYKAYNYKQAIKKLYQDPVFEEAKPLLDLLDESQLKMAVIAAIESLSIAEALEEVDRGKYRLWPQSHFGNCLTCFQSLFASGNPHLPERLS